MKAGLNEPFILAWGDNLMDLDVTKMAQEYQNNKAPIIMVLTPRVDVENFGVASLEGSKILSFVEKTKTRRRTIQLNQTPELSLLIHNV